MQLIEVDEQGAVLVYRSTRSGFSKYLRGQLMEIAKQLYNMDVTIKVLESQNDVPGGTAGPISIQGGLKTVIVKYRLDFDNRDYVSMHNELCNRSVKTVISTEVRTSAKI